MIKSTFGITQEPFYRQQPNLLPQQNAIAEIIRIHAQHGGFSVIIGAPGVGKSVLREHIEAFANHRDTVVASFSRTMHTYLNILRQLGETLRLDEPAKALENALIQTAFQHIKARKTLYILIDEAHLMAVPVLRKLRLLFDRFPKKHNLVLFGQPELLYYLSMTVNDDIKSRITYSQRLLPLNDNDLQQFILGELDQVGLGHNTFDPAAIELILRCAEGNLRLCRNLCYSSLVDACRAGKRTVLTAHVNSVLIQPHWRSHEELIKQQVT